ncbi:MAG: hypothetical protein M1546_06005 [Chloroflexi bacterium]|nr:hypothetical protein [Chloroflexota bacterium]
MPQAHALIAQAIEDQVRPIRDVFAILHYRQCRNRAAYLSHRKRALNQLRKKRLASPKREVS